MYFRGVFILVFCALFLSIAVVTQGPLAWEFPVELAIFAAMWLDVRKMHRIEVPIDWKVMDEWRRAPDSPERREYFAATQRRSLTGLALSAGLLAGFALGLYVAYFWYS